MGVGIYYSDSPVGLPPVMTHFLKNIDALHGVGVGGWIYRSEGGGGGVTAHLLKNIDALHGVGVGGSIDLMRRCQGALPL